MEKFEKKNRIEWVDIGKFICIMFVMLSHLQSGTSVLFKLYSPFFLTVFFFLSGYVYTQPASFKVHISKKLKGLFVPWLIFSNINIALSMLISFKENRNFLSEFGWNMLQIRGQGDGIWFVAALFAAFIPFYFFIKWNKPGKAIALSVILSILSSAYSHLFPAELLPWGSTSLPWHLEYIFQAMLWMILGYYFKKYFEKSFDKLNNLRNRIIIWAVYLIVAYVPDTFAGDFSKVALAYIRSFIGIFAVVSLCKVVKSNKYIKFVGANTLTYFALHGKLYALIEKALSTVAANFYTLCLNNVWTSSILAIVITLLMSVILIIPAVIINKYFPWILGRKKQKNKSTQSN